MNVKWIKFAAKRFIWSNRTQKTNYRALNELSNDGQHSWTWPKQKANKTSQSWRIFQIFNLKPFKILHLHDTWQVDTRRASCRPPIASTWANNRPPWVSHQAVRRSGRLGSSVRRITSCTHRSRRAAAPPSRPQVGAFFTHLPLWSPAKFRNFHCVHSNFCVKNGFHLTSTVKNATKVENLVEFCSCSSWKFSFEDENSMKTEPLMEKCSRKRRRSVPCGWRGTGTTQQFGRWNIGRRWRRDQRWFDAGLFADQFRRRNGGRRTSRARQFTQEPPG